jgi:hypothetical protein
MDANQVVVHEIDGPRMHLVLDDLADGALALGTEPAVTGSYAFRKAVTLLSIYRSRVDFLKQCEIESGIAATPPAIH